MCFTLANSFGIVTGCCLELMTPLKITCLQLWVFLLAMGAAKKLTPEQKERSNAVYETSKQHRSFKRIYDEYHLMEQTNSSLVKDYGAKTQKQLRFIHLPKTGTTFAATMMHYCCPGLDYEYANVVRQFNSLVPTASLAELCNPECFKIQPRSPNGDPWAHIPFRSGIDSNQATIAMFRSPEARLASQFSYMRVMGPKLAMSFGLRRLDGQILFRLLSGGYDQELKNLIAQLVLTSASTTNQASLPTKLTEYAFSLTSAHTHRLTQYDKTPFVKRALECAKLPIKHNLPLSLLKAMQNMSISVSTTSKQLEKYFKKPTEVEKFLDCGREAAALYPGLQGCQTRMILGRNCYDTYTLTVEDVMEAKRRLSDEFLFVGLTEQWRTSVELFHTKFGGKMFDDELVKQRSAKDNMQQASQKMVQLIQKVAGRDPFDGAIYEHVRGLFDRELTKYKGL